MHKNIDITNKEKKTAGCFGYIPLKSLLGSQHKGGVCLTVPELKSNCVLW